MISTMFSSASLAAVTTVVMFLLTYMPYVIVIAMEAVFGLGYKLLIVSRADSLVPRRRILVRARKKKSENTRTINFCSPVPEHVHQLLLRMPVRSAEGGPRHRPLVGTRLGGVESWRPNVLGAGVADYRVRRMSVRGDRLSRHQIH